VSAGLDPADGRLLEQAYLRLWGISPVFRDAGGASGLPDVGGGQEIGRYRVEETYLRETEELLREAVTAAGELPVGAARSILESDLRFVPRTMWRELLHVLEQRLGLERRGGVLRPRQGLSPGEQAVLDAVRAAGGHGEHVKSARMAKARPIVSRLVSGGFVVRLENGRLYATEVYRRFAEIDEEIDDRRASELWGVSRNTARELMRRLVADGLLRSTSPKTAAPAEVASGRRTR
jgi:hypothetical protein